MKSSLEFSKKLMVNLHEHDLNLWLEQQAIAIKNKNIDSMDWQNLLEEIEDMGASQKRALRSYVKQLIKHLLKLKYWHTELERNKAGWELEVSNFRDEILDILADSPSLKNYLETNYDVWYQKSADKKKLGFDLPEHEQISIDEILDENYFG